MQIRFHKEMKDEILSCISQSQKNPTLDNIETQIRKLGIFFDDKLTGLAAEIELIGSALEKAKNESPDDPDLLLEKVSQLTKVNEQLQTENNLLKKKRDKVENQLRELEGGRGKELEDLVEHYKKERIRLVDTMKTLVGDSDHLQTISSLNEQINALNLEISQILRSIEAKDDELEEIKVMYRWAEFAHAQKEAALNKRIQRLEEKLASMDTQDSSPKSKDTHKPLKKQDSPEPKKKYPPICGWQVFFNEEKGTFYAQRSIYGKLPLILYVGKALSPSIIKRVIPKIKRKEAKEGLGPMPLRANDLALGLKEKSS